MVKKGLIVVRQKKIIWVLGFTFGQDACRGGICPGQGVIKDGELGFRAVGLQQVYLRIHAQLSGGARDSQGGRHLHTNTAASCFMGRVRKQCLLALPSMAIKDFWTCHCGASEPSWK